TPGTGLGEGLHSFTAESVDAAGNSSPRSPAYALELDFTAPTIGAQAFSYDEDQVVGAAVATVLASDNESVVDYQFKWADNSLHATSEDGYFAINSAGVISLTAVGVASGANDFERSPNSWSYLVFALDAAGNSNAASIGLSEKNLNDTAPVVGSAVAVAVSEEGLTALGGLADSSGNPNDSTDEVIVRGTVPVSDADGDSVTVTLSAPTTAITSAGTVLTWSGTGTGHLVGSVGSTEIIDVSIDNGGNYTVHLLGAIDQASGGGENILTANFGVNVSDGTQTTSNPTAITVNIEDDAPQSQPVTNAVVGTSTVDSNLMFVLDLSGSMDSDSGMQGLSRLEATVAAIKEVLEQYGSIGDVKVNISTFGTTATSGSWLTVSQAEAFLDTVSANAGTTNYDAALAAAMSAYSNGVKLSGQNVQNVLYFLSDGAPNTGDGNANLLLNASGGSDDGIQTAEQSVWTNFLSANDINAFAIGLGTGVTVETMSPVAYDGIQNQDRDAISVTDMSTLRSTLVSLVQSTVAGSLLVTGDGFGADGGYLGNISYGNNVFSFDGGSGLTRSGSGMTAYSFDVATHALSISAVGGTFVVDMDSGAYSYTTSIGTMVTEEQFGYTLLDHDGDSSSSIFVIDFASIGAAPIARDDNVIVASGNVSSNSVTIQDSWLAWNDSDIGGNALSISSVSNAVSHTGGQVVDAVSASNNGTGSFSYVLDNGSKTDEAQVALTTTSSTGLYGTGLDNIIVGDTSGEVLYGYAGNDVLVGNAGNDTFYGGEGNDLLIGGLGNDSLTGDAGADVFRWLFADKGGAGSPATDTVYGFSTTTSGEALDLRDLLQGENHDIGIGNLANYLDITTSGGNTVIRVSSSGGFSNGSYSSNAEDQRISLSNVNLYTTYGVTPGEDGALIQKLLDSSKLKVD
ncbi:MAG: tandem-95 repeat protein, partial [Proteobacteria bacterium]|nr:tandem-95 repeat protein [Pseudomonadota bacterium]